MKRTHEPLLCHSCGHPSMRIDGAVYGVQRAIDESAGGERRLGGFTIPAGLPVSFICERCGHSTPSTRVAVDNRCADGPVEVPPDGVLPCPRCSSKVELKLVGRPDEGSPMLGAVGCTRCTYLSPADGKVDRVVKKHLEMCGRKERKQT